MQNKLTKLSPQTTLLGIFLVSVSLVCAVTLFPQLFYRKFDASLYLTFHNFVELFGAIVCISIFGVGWYAFDQSKNRHALFLSTMFLGVGLMGLMHTLSFPGMPPFVTPNSSNKCNQFWLAFRLYYALAFLASAYVYPDTRNRLLTKTSLLLFSVAVSMIVFCAVIYYLSHLPLTFIDGKGLTPFKVFSEYVIIGLLAISLGAYWKRYNRTNDKLLILYISALALSIVSEFSFTLYNSFADTYHVLGHVCELGAFYLIYKGVFTTSVRNPYEKLRDSSRALAEEIVERRRAEDSLREEKNFSDTIIQSLPGVFILFGTDGRLLRWNESLETVTGYSYQEITQRSPLSFFSEKKQLVFQEAITHSTDHGELAVEADILTKDGIEIPYFFRGNQKRLNQTNCVVWIGIDISERKRLENEIKFKNILLSTQHEVSIDGILVVDEHGKILSFNSRFVDMWEIPREVIDAKNDELALQFVLDNLEQPEEFLKKVSYLYTYKDETSRDEICLKDGRTFDRYSAPMLGADGRNYGRVWYFRDITDRKTAEEELRQSEKRFRSFIESAPDAIFVQTRGCFAYVNKATQQLFRVDSPDSLLGTPVVDYFQASDSAAIKEQMRKLNIEKEPTPPREQKFIRQDGSTVSVEVSTVPVRFENEDGALVFARDLTERFLAEKERLRLFTAIEQTAASVLITSPDGTIEYVNPAFQKITGYASDEVIGKNPKMLQSGKQDKSFYEDLWKTISGGNVWNGRLINRRKDGSIVHEDGAISPVKDSNGNIVNYVQVTQDVTKEVELQNQLVQAQKLEAIGTLAGGIAHDFNNILFAITGFTELAMLDLPADSRARSNLERVMHAARRSGDMIKQILAFSRQGENEVTAIDLMPLVKEGLKFLRAAIPTTIELSQKIGPNLGKVIADPTQIHQVLMNLCVNASHAIKDNKGTISVELSEVELKADFTTDNPPLVPGKHLRLTVTDTGVGIPSEIVDKIFDPYFTTKDAGKGTGLGLSVVHGIVEKHKGAITITSELGKGSTFNVFLPVVEKEEPQSETSSESDVTPTGKEHILVVDDESHLLEMYERQLKRLGYEVTCSSNPEEVLELFRTDPLKFDLVITDFTMPKMTGIELAMELGSIRPGIPMILCSGVSQVVSESVTKEAGIQSVIYKPIRRPEIAQAIRKALDKDVGELTSD